jgi:hypothetical protein
MEDLELLRFSYEIIQDGIERTLADIVSPYETCKDFAGRMSMITDHYRMRGMLRFLFEADVESFFEDLNREALTYLTVLKAYHSKMDFANEFVWPSYYPVVCAIATTNFSICQEIDGLVPEWEDVDDTAVMLRKLAVEGEEDIAAILPDFKNECEEEGGRNRHMVTMTQGLISEQTVTFNEGLLKYLLSFDTITPEEAEEMWPGEQYIRVEALAFIQLAKRKNMPITVTHKMIPPELQDARLIIPKSGYPAWPG